MTKLKFLFISWQELHNLCFKLALKIEKENLRFDRIVCISRGGLIVARIFSDFLDLPISNFTIVSYVSVGNIGKPKIVEKLSIDIRNEKILLIDEIVDSGITFKKANVYLKELSPKSITTLAPVIKPWSKPKPDIWTLKTGKWVIFSYEIKETIKDLIKIWQKNKLTHEQMKKEFFKIGLPKKQVEYFLKNNL
ncbi:phosphoribosyltransferase [Patescibacteria group bacterium]